ncbi:hypothetical protein E2C01_071385 [Portunus trituberculatus]|uniref:Uncharacterized protein n=1 Tax=Portunus trituberculatus TaxID=210409 RepID=A0A5B7I7V0_PORTR|nr:hypothetical protein [Portunus trituberculatus]
MRWSIVNDVQGVMRDSTIPPLNKSDGTTATTSRKKVNLLAEHFSRKMTIPDPTYLPLSPPMVARDTLTSLTTTEEEVRATLTKLEEDKAVGPDELSPRVLLRCATELAPHLTLIFGPILRHNR